LFPNEICFFSITLVDYFFLTLAVPNKHRI
jgi:hypothetical protein